MRPFAFSGLFALAVFAACHDADKDRGTCVSPPTSGVAAQCVANVPRPGCAGVFTMEAASAGLTRCKGAGDDKVDAIAVSCDGGFTRTFDMSRNGAVPEDMIKSAFNNDCAVRFTKNQ
ncbi:MAG TPA: hypothetical protein VGM39_04820 [Kofleriaceae bacterium]